MASIKRNKNAIINNINNKLKSINNNSNKQNSENLNIKEININSNYIEKSFLAELLKCEICNNIFDLNIHIPMVGKCGHTFCKKCIIEKHFNKKKSDQYDECPIDNMKNIFNIESFVINLRVELLIRKIFTQTNIKISSIQTTPQNMNQKKIVYKKKTKNNNNQNFNNNDMNLNFKSPNIYNKNGEYGYRKLDINSESNKKNNFINDNLSSPQIEEEMNVNNENKILFEDEKVNGVIINETIDTIPIFDEKSLGNVSFKEDVNELFSKNNVINKKLLNENIKNELNKSKNKYHANTNLKKKPQKKNTESDINQKDKFSKTETNFWLSPNVGKDNQIINNNYNNSNKKKVIMNSNSVGEEEDLSKYKNNTHQVRTVFDKIQLKLNEPILNNYDSESNNNVIVINKPNNKENLKNKKDLYVNNRYLPNKKVIHFTKSNTNNNNRLNTNPNNKENKLKMSVVLNKNANILSTNILRKSNNNTMETKDENIYQDFILSSNKKKLKNDVHLYNSSDNENDILVNKNRTYNSKKNNSIHNSILDNIMDNSNNEYLNKNIEVNKNLKVLNKSNNNNNSSFFANSNSNSVYNKKNIIYSDKGFQNMINKDENEDKEIAQLEKFASVTTKESNNIFKKLNKNSKSQMLDNINSNSNLNIKDDTNKLRISFGKRKNNVESRSTIIVKKSKNTSPIFSTKHTKKNSIIINYNKNNKDNKDNNIDNILSGKKFLLNDTNMRRANSFITNNNILNTTNNNNSNSQNINASISKSQNEAFSSQLPNSNVNSGSKQTKEEIKQSLENNLYSLIKRLKNKNINFNEKKYQEMLEEILNDQNYENILEKIAIKYFDNKDFFIGIMDNNNKYPLKGALLYHNGDYYKGEFSEGRKNGNGVIKYKNQTRYEGTFKNDRHDGYGKLIQLDGEIFEGEWKNGKINGNGVRLHSNGDKYIGSYVNNIRNGQGHYIFINGDSYNGNWVNGKANGLGTFKFKNGNIYEGEFKDNIILGKGILTMQNGDMYIGTFLNGILNGKGTFINNMGEKFIGVFERGKKNGEGKLFDKNGKLIKEGTWKNDVFINDSI